MAENDIDVGFLMKESFRSILDDPGYILIYLLPILAIFAYNITLWLFIGDLQNMVTRNIQIQKPTVLIDMFQNQIIFIVISAIFFLIIIAILATISIAAIIKKVEIQKNNETIGVLDALSYGLKIFPRLFGAILFAVLIIGGPFILISILMIFFAINNLVLGICLTSLLLLVLGILYIYVILRLALFSIACVIDDLGPIDCFKKSWQVTKGNVILIFVTLLILGVISIAVNIPSIIMSNAGIPYASSIYNIISTIFLTPFYYITLTLLYMELTGKNKDISPSYQGSYNDIPV
jgi:hypothetical protein